MNYKPLPTLIYCDGVAPTKAEVYTLAAELQELHEFEHFREAVMSALKSYDYGYYYYEDCYPYDYPNNHHEYSPDYSDLSKEEKVLALLFLAAMYSS